MVCYEPSHLDLHCLQRYLYWSIEMKGLNITIHVKNGNIVFKALLGRKHMQGMMPV